MPHALQCRRLHGCVPPGSYRLRISVWNSRNSLNRRCALPCSPSTYQRGMGWHSMVAPKVPIACHVLQVKQGQPRTTSHSMAWHSMAWHSMAWHSMAWHSIAGLPLSQSRIRCDSPAEGSRLGLVRRGDGHEEPIRAEISAKASSVPGACQAKVMLAMMPTTGLKHRGASTGEGPRSVQARGLVFIAHLLNTHYSNLHRVTNWCF